MTTVAVMGLTGLCVLGCSGAGGEALQGTLVNLEAGDVACYVEIHDGAEPLYLDGDFELCPGGAMDASGLVGKPITYTTETAQVMAGSCEGNPDCTDTEEVAIVVGIEAVQ
jgi:hypothetical protein